MWRSMKRLILAGALLAVLPLAGQALGESPTLYQVAEDRALRFGDRGEYVLALQEMLLSAGFDPGPLDGIFGPLTEAAVRRSQESLSIQVDGMAGEQTVAALTQELESGEEIGEATPVSLPAAITSPSGLTLLAAHHEQNDQPAPDAQVQADVAPKLFALTLNGTPDPVLTPRLLEILGQNEMQATFFIQGKDAVTSTETIAQVVAEGHEIGNNGADDTDPTSLTPASLTAQLVRTQNALEMTVGAVPTFYRPPAGRFDSKTLKAAQDVGMKTVLWTNVTVKDLPEIGEEELADRLERSVYPGAILMLHQDRPNSIAALELLLSRLRDKGYQSVGLSELLDH